MFELLKDDAQRILRQCIIIDTETTGLGDDAAVIELAAIDGESGEILINDVCFSEKAIQNWSDEAEGVHKISKEEVQAGVSANTLIRDLYNKAKFKHFSAYNLSFDNRLINQTYDGYERHFNQCDDVMELANRFFIRHARWDQKESRFRRLSLARCCEIAGIQFKGQAHRALSDAQATRDLLLHIAMS